MASCSLIHQKCASTCVFFIGAKVLSRLRQGLRILRVTVRRTIPVVDDSMPPPRMVRRVVFVILMEASLCQSRTAAA